MDGEEWLRKSGESKVKRWGTNEVELYNKVMEVSETCFDALMGCQQQKYFDMDGATYVESLVELSEQGRAYMTKVAPSEGPTEPLYEALRLLRDKLSLVGFSDATVRAGRDDVTTTRRGNIVGGERALAEQLVQFRSAVRKYALDDIRNNGDSSSLNTKEILRLCDEARDDILPSIGLELNDDKMEDDNDLIMTELNQTGDFACHETAVKRPAISLKRVQHELFLTIHPWKTCFELVSTRVSFHPLTMDGIPTHYEDGSEVSKTLRKKLVKKREKYQKRQPH